MHLVCVLRWIGTLCLAWLLSDAHPLGATERPNVLMIAVDDLNHWVGHFGRNPQAKTPNLDRLASRGVTFTRAYCAVPACNPSRAALLSGMRPWQTACYKNRDFWKQHIPVGRGLTVPFLKAGYRVSGAGKIYHSDSFYPSEWTEYMPKQGFTAHGRGVAKMEGFHEPLAHDLKDEDLGDWQSVDWCIERLQQPTDKPWFIACGLHKPHLPFAVPRKYYAQFPLEGIQLPPHIQGDLDDIPAAGIKMAKPKGDHQRFLKSNRWKAAIQSYLATIAYTDMNIGRLLQALERSPHRDHTIIVLWGDHGWHFGEKEHWRKFALWEEATRVPLIWVVPGLTPKGRVCERAVDLMCVYPTLCELVGLAIPEHVTSPSIRPLLKDPNAAWDRPAVTTHGFRNHAVRSTDWRYIRYADGSEELYQHQTDPYEWKNLAGDPKYQEVIAQLAQWLPTKQREPRQSKLKR